MVTLVKIPVTIRLPEELVLWLRDRKKTTGLPIEKTVEEALSKFKKKAG